MKKIIICVVVTVLFFTTTCYAAEDPYHSARNAMLSEWQELMTNSIGELYNLSGIEFRDGVLNEIDPLPEIPLYTAQMALTFKNKLFFAEYDFDCNGIDELVIANEIYSYKHILGIYVFDGTQMRYLFRESPLREKTNFMDYNPDAKKLSVIQSFGVTDNITYIYTFTDDSIFPEVEEINEIMDISDPPYQWFEENHLVYTQLTEEDGAPLPLPE